MKAARQPAFMNMLQPGVLIKLLVRWIIWTFEIAYEDGMVYFWYKLRNKTQ